MISFLVAQAVSDQADSAVKAAEAVTTVGSDVPLFSWGGYFQALGIMCLLLALLWLAVWLVRRSGKFKFLPLPDSLPKDALRLETQIPLAPKKRLVVVRFLNKHLLLGVTDQQITLIQETEIDDDSSDLDSFSRSDTAPEQSGQTGHPKRNFAQFFSSSYATDDGHTDTLRQSTLKCSSTNTQSE